MNLGVTLRSFGVKFGDDFVKDRIARLVTIYFDEETEGLVMLQDGDGLLAEFLKACTEDL